MSQTATLIDIQEVQRALSTILEPGQVFEIRILEAVTDNPRYPATLAGYFKNTAESRALLIKELRRVRSALGFYITPQVCHPDLINRIYQTLKNQKRDYSTSDDTVTRYRWLLIDSDPERISHISTANEQHEQALQHSLAIASYLRDIGFPEPLRADSGNGGHLLYPIDLPNTPEHVGLISRFLQALSERFNRDGIKVDTTVFNPSRIWKLYGTPACKGSDTPERPHRMARILSIPDKREVASQELLESIALPVAQESTHKDTSGKSNTTFDMERWLDDHHIEHKPAELYKGGKRWPLAECPFCHNSDHNAIVTQSAAGALGFRCQHNSCRNTYNWQEFRSQFEPDAYSKKQQQGPKTDNEDSGDDDPLDLCRFDADDAGNGDAMYVLFKRSFLYCHARGWFTYTGRYWQHDPSACSVKRAAVTTLRKRRHEAVEKDRDAIIKCTKANDKAVNGCVNRFMTLVTVDIDEFDNDKNKLNCLNGVVDLRDGSLAPHSHQQRYTYCLAVPYEEADSTEWLNFLSRSVGGGGEIIDYLQELTGYSLTGHIREELIVYLHGPTRAGKGTFAEVFSALLQRPLAANVDFNSFTAKREGDVSNFDLAPLKPCRLVFASESNRGQSLNPAKIKQLTGGDPITCSFKHRDHFSYVPQFTAWMLSNWPVNGDPEDDALWGRVRVIEFPSSFLGKEDKKLKERLKSPESLKGVLWWAVQGAMRWYAREAGLVTPEAVKLATQAHRDELDYVKRWIDECCESEKTAWTSNERVTASYLAWCKSNGVQYPKGPKSLAQSLKAKGYTPGVQKKHAGKNKKGVQGLIVTFSPYDDEKVTDGNDSSDQPLPVVNQPVERDEESSLEEGNVCNGRIPYSPYKETTLEESQNQALQTLPSSKNTGFACSTGGLTTGNGSCDPTVTSYAGTTHTWDEIKTLMKEFGSRLKDRERTSALKMFWSIGQGYENGLIDEKEFYARVKKCVESKKKHQVQAAIDEMLQQLGRLEAKRR